MMMTNEGIFRADQECAGTCFQYQQPFMEQAALNIAAIQDKNVAYLMAT